MSGAPSAPATEAADPNAPPRDATTDGGQIPAPTPAGRAATVSRSSSGSARQATRACGRAAATGIAGFFAALSDGRVPRAERYVTTDGFVGFVLGARDGFGARDGRTRKAPALAANRTVWYRWRLAGYLRQRVRQHDRFRLDSLRVAFEGDGRVGFQVAAYRSANDLAGGGRLPLVAKGEWVCGPRLLTGLFGHADLRGGNLPSNFRCPAKAERVAGARVC